jgi:hypothetical protein
MVRYRVKKRRYGGRAVCSQWILILCSRMFAVTGIPDIIHPRTWRKRFATGPKWSCSHVSSWCEKTLVSRAMGVAFRLRGRHRCKAGEGRSSRAERSLLETGRASLPMLRGRRGRETCVRGGRSCAPVCMRRWATQAQQCCPTRPQRCTWNVDCSPEEHRGKSRTGLTRAVVQCSMHSTARCWLEGGLIGDVAAQCRKSEEFGEEEGMKTIRKDGSMQPEEKLKASDVRTCVKQASDRQDAALETTGERNGRGRGEVLPGRRFMSCHRRRQERRR